MPIVFTSRTFSVEVMQKRLPNGREHEISVVRHVPSVVLLPMKDTRTVILIRQYRASVDKELWEVPAGSLNEGETPEEAAIRECEEEIGLVPRRLERVRGLFPAPGFCDEELIFYRASRLERPSPDSPHRPDDDEDIDARTFEIRAAREMVAREEIVDLKTAHGLTLL